MKIFAVAAVLVAGTGNGEDALIVLSIDAREVKARADMLAVVGRYTRLKYKGREWVGLCPLHSERHPSFYVHPEKKVFYCFGCGVGGDLFDFVMRAEGCDFLDAALRIVADFSSGVGPLSELRSSERFQRPVGASPGPAQRGTLHSWKPEPKPCAIPGACSWPSLECAAEAAAELRGGGSFT